MLTTLEQQEPKLSLVLVQFISLLSFKKLALGATQFEISEALIALV